MSRPAIAIYIIAILHIVGLFGLNSAFREFFSLLTPVNLLATAGLFFWSCKGKNTRGYLSVLLIFVCGFGIEWVGVNTGFPFGKYEYGTVLGPKVGNTPLLIGVNWSMLVLSVVFIGRLVAKSAWAIGLVGGALMTALDILIEPVAIKTGMWHWFGQQPPVQNYVAWFVIAAILSAAVHKMAPQLKNPAGAGFFAIQVIFFAVMALVGIANG
jgi:putative membrane protein